MKPDTSTPDTSTYETLIAVEVDLEPRVRYWVNEALRSAEDLPIRERRLAHDFVYAILDAFAENPKLDVVLELSNLTEEIQTRVKFLRRRKQTDRNLDIFSYATTGFVVLGLVLTLIGVSVSTLIVAVPIAITSTLGLLNIILVLQKLFKRED